MGIADEGNLNQGMVGLGDSQVNIICTTKLEFFL
jgi:hypothetical protein